MNAEHSDVTFVIENTKIPAHKSILSSRCSYFQGLFRGGFAEATQSDIKLIVPLDAFKVILRFIYTGCMSLIPLNVNQIIDVYGLVELYDFETLKNFISKYLTTKLSVDNCFEIINAAYLYSRNDLENACLTFLDRRSTKLIKHNTFKSITSTLLCTLLKRDTFYAPEIDIFNAVKEWTINNPTADPKVKCCSLNQKPFDQCIFIEFPL